MDVVSVGVCGDTKDYNLKFYKHKQLGSDRYSLALDVCGMIGMRAGIEAEMSLSFFGLQKLGEVGISFEFGVFAQLNGYAHYELWDDTWEADYPRRGEDYYGGIYLQIGIYIDVNLFARSEVFDAESSTSLYSMEMVLFSAGERRILVEIVPGDESQNVVVLRGDSTLLDSVTSVDGLFLDIVTGDAISGPYTGDNIWVNFDHPSLFTYDMKTRTIKKNQAAFESPQYKYEVSVTTKMHVYYTGESCLRMNASQNLRGAQWMYDVDCIWVQEDFDFEVSNFGKAVTATFVLDVNGERTTIGTREVIAGGILGGVAISNVLHQQYVMDYDKEVAERNITDIYWTKDGDDKKIENIRRTGISRDTTFVYHTYYWLYDVAFVYYDGDEWIAEVKTVPYNAEFTSPTVQEFSDKAFSGWNGYAFDSEGKPYFSTIGIGEVNHTRIPSKNFVDFNSDSLDFATSEAALEYVAQHYLEKVDVCYVAKYVAPYHKVTLSYKRGFQDNVTVESRTKYVQNGTKPDDSGIGAPYGKELVGWATEENGAKVYNAGELPILNVTEDVVFYAVYDDQHFNVTLYDFDGTTKLYDTFTLPFNSTFPSELMTALDNRPALEDGVRVAEVFWRVGATKESSIRCNYAATDKVTYSVNCYLSYRVEYAVTLKVNSGTIDGADSLQVWHESKTDLQLRSYNNKVVFTGLPESSDARYELAGWKDNDGKVYGLADSVTITKPITLTAQYTDVPVVYTATITTEKGVLKNGEKSHFYAPTVEGYDGYEGFIAFTEGYMRDNFIPEDVTIDDVVYECYSSTLTDTTDPDTFDRVYTLRMNWRVKIYYFTVTINLNCYEGWAGSDNVSSNLEANSEFTFPVQSPTGSAADGLCHYPTAAQAARYDFTLDGYDLDNDGDVDVLPGGSITLTENVNAKAIWSSTEKTFTITLDCSEGGKFADDTTSKTIGNLAYDSVIDYASLDKPSPTAQYEHYEFKDWIAKDSNGVHILKPDKITQNVTLYASFEAIKYSVIFKLIDAETGLTNENYKTVSVTYGNVAGNNAPDIDVITENGARLFSGWRYISGGNGGAIFEATTPVVSDTVVKGTVSSVHVTYTLGGIKHESIETDIGANVTVKAPHSGYEDWEMVTEGITVTDGTFTMPENDVIINAARIMTGILSVSDGTNTDEYNVAEGTGPASKLVSGYTYEIATKLLTINANGLTLSGEPAGMSMVIASGVTDVTFKDFSLTTEFDDRATLVLALGADLTVNIDGTVTLTATAKTPTDPDLPFAPTTAFKLALESGEYGKLTIKGSSTDDKLVMVAQETALSVTGALYIEDLTIESTSYSIGLTASPAGGEWITDNASIVIDSTVLNINTSATEDMYQYFSAISSGNALSITDSTVTTQSMMVAYYSVTLTNCLLDCDYVASNNENADVGEVIINGTSSGSIGVATESWAIYSSTVTISLASGKTLELISNTCAICTKIENGLTLENCDTILTCYHNAGDMYYYSTTAEAPYTTVDNCTLVGVNA